VTLAIAIFDPEGIWSGNREDPTACKMTTVVAINADPSLRAKDYQAPTYSQIDAECRGDA
jgi:hypothetical protein